MLSKRVRRALIIAVVVAAVAAVVVGWLWLHGAARPMDPRPTMVPNGQGAATPEEDEPGWDCHTMGNMVCGYEVNPGADLSLGA
jgi:hypothetical protein